MDWETFAERLHDAQARLHDLRLRYPEASRVPASAGDGGDSVMETLQELDESVSELAAAQADLRTHIAQLKDARRELRDQRRRYRTLFFSAPAAYFVTTVEGVVRDANQQAGALLNIRPRFLIGKPLVLYIAASQRRAFHERLSLLAKSGDSAYEWPLAMRPRGGKPLEASATVVCGIDPIENCRELQWLILDVTARLREERALQQANADLEQRVNERTHELEEASRAKNDFLASLSHELRTPVNVIRGFAHMLKTGTVDPGASARAIDAIDRNAARQTRLVGDLLDVSRINAGKFALKQRKTDLRDALAAAEETAAVDAETKQLQLHTEIPDEPAWVWGDAERLQQVFDNLLSNAIKFTPPQGDIWLALAQEGSSWRVTVRDSGIGIAPEFMPSLFQRFHQADVGSTGAYSGLGLGLSIVRSIIEMHGGAVTAASAGRDAGATFTCTLPALATETASSSPGDDPRFAGNPL
jgi:PAS domain S-box-containing protein